MEENYTTVEENFDVSSDSEDEGLGVKVVKVVLAAAGCGLLAGGGYVLGKRRERAAMQEKLAIYIDKMPISDSEKEGWRDAVGIEKEKKGYTKIPSRKEREERQK